MKSDDGGMFSAKLPRFFGPPTGSPVVRVRDVAVCVTGGGGSGDDYRAHPPIASPILRRDYTEADPGPFDLQRGMRIDRLTNAEAELVMNACTPRGHNFSPIRQFGQRYAFVREYGPEEYEERPYHWDPDGLITDALMMSRLIRDNAYSTQYAARIIDYEDGTQIVAWTPGSESRHVYRLRQDRDWLDHADADNLRTLLAAWWAAEDELPPRVRRASWRTEYASWLKWGDLALAMIVGGLEALLKTDQYGATKQFVTRVPALATELGFSGVTSDLCDRMYDTRSEWVHGAQVRLFASGLEAQRDEETGAAEGPQSEEQGDRFGEIRRIQDVLRRAVRQTIEDPAFREVFADDSSIRARWPVPRS